MDRQELHDLLLAKGIRSDAFDVQGVDLHPIPGGIYVLRLFRSGRVGEPHRWAIYYSERGLMTGLQEYVSEDEACRAFLLWIDTDRAAFR